MKIVLDQYFDHWSSQAFELEAEKHLEANGYSSVVIKSRSNLTGLVNHEDIYLTRGILPVEFINRPRSYGGRNLSRPDSMFLVQNAGLASMDWFLAKNQDDLMNEFQRSGCEYLILKKSGTYKGEGVIMFKKSHIACVDWDPAKDIFCHEVSPADGTVYKVECFAGNITICWSYFKPPLREIIDNPKCGRIISEDWRREIETPIPFEILERYKQFSQDLAELGYGYTSFDIMFSEQHGYIVIEINTQEVASWWTASYQTALENYAQAVLGLVAKISQG